MEATVEYQVARQIISNYEDARFPDGSLAFRFDYERMVIEIQYRGHKHYFDLPAMHVQGLGQVGAKWR